MTLTPTIYDQGLDRCDANFAALSPLSFIERTAAIYPDRLAVVHGAVRRTWAETYDRCRRLAGALAARGIGRGDTVAVIAANIPEMFEAHFGVPMSGAVLNTINTRLDAEAIAFILNHGEAKVVLVDPEFSEVVQRALRMAGRDRRAAGPRRRRLNQGGSRLVPIGAKARYNSIQLAQTPVTWQS